MLPNTIACTFTAVPQSAGMSCSRRYVLARGFIQLPNTAPIAAHNWSCGAIGNARPVSSSTSCLYSSTTRCQSAGDSAVSSTTPASILAVSMISSKRWWSTPSTTLPNIWMKRRKLSHANRSSPLVAASPSTVSSFRPRFSTVSIMPGIDTRAPERTETSSGAPWSPNDRPTACSIRASASRTCASRSAG